MKNLHLLVLTLGLASCAIFDPDHEPAPVAMGLDASTTSSLATIEVRPVVSPDTPGAIPFRADGETLPLGRPTNFRVSRAYATEDSFGLRAVGFEIAEPDREAFTEHTRSMIDSRMAVIVGGQLVCAPVVQEALPGSGIIAGGGEGFDEAQVAAMLAALQPR